MSVNDPSTRRILVFAKPGCPACAVHKENLYEVMRQWPNVLVHVVEEDGSRKTENLMADYHVEAYPTTVIVDTKEGKLSKELAWEEGTMDQFQLTQFFYEAARG